MSKHLATNRNRPCPICDKTNGNCRSYTEDDKILCMTFADKYSANNNPDYRFTKPTKNGGLWGIYYPRTDDDNSFNPEKWEREKQQRAAKEAERLRLIEIKALSVADRDRDIRAILSQLTLTESDQALLHQRELTDQQIEALGYRSVKKFQVIEGDIRFGVRYGRLLNKVQGEYIEGILIPVPDVNGHYTALRINNPKHKENGKPKYFPLIGSHLKSGELPLAVYGPEKAKGTTGLSESVEFKPAIASLRLGIPIIGANGANHSGSPQQLKESLEALNTSQVVLYVDAGMLTNQTVLAGYERTINLVESWGYPVVIAWWGQFTKADGDIDEIGTEAIIAIQYLTPGEFWQLCPERQGKVSQFKEWLGKQLERIKPKGFGVPKIEGTEFTGNRAKAWLETDGDVLDASAPGSGKSHTVLQVENSEGKGWYVSNDHRNPTVKKIADEFTDLFPRNQHGFYRDKQGKLVKATEDTPKEKIETTRGKCPLAGMFTHLANLGHNPNEGGSKNEICQSCPYLNICQSAEGWYLKDRRDTLTNAHKIRCHIESMPREFDYSKDIVFYDEPSQLFKPTKDINATENQVYLDLKRVRKALNNDQFLAIDGILQGLSPLFENRQKYGLDHDKIIDALTGIKRPEDLDDVIEAITSHPLGLSNIFQQPDVPVESILTQQERQRYRGLTKAVNAVENVKALRVNENALQNIPPNTLIHILKALRGDKGIALSVAYGTLTITLDNLANYAFVNRTKKNIYLDATSSVEDLIKMTGSDRRITAIRSKVKPTNNLRVVQIKTKGIGSTQVSDKAIERVRAICQTLGEMPVIGPKSWKESLDIDGHWFNHNRGSNDFEGLPNLLVLGLPRPNLGMIKAEYYALNGTRQGFEEYYQRRINQEIVQVVGRPRANRYPDQQFTIYFVTPEDTDLSWLSDFGCKVTVKSAFEITPEAGTETQCTRYHIFQMVKECLDKGVRTTQSAIAAAIGKTQQAVSHTLKQAGLTLHQLTQMIEDLLPDSHTNRPNNYQERSICMTDWLYGDFALFFDLPIEAIAQDAITTIETYGLDYFWEYLSNFPKALQAKYLTALKFIITNGEDLAQLNPSQ